MEWFDTIVNETTTTGEQDFQEVSSGIVADERKGMTLLRTLIDLTSVVISAGSGGLISMGLYMVHTEAAGAVAFPDANEQDDQGWIWRSGPRVISATNINDISANNRWIFDLKGKRRFPSEDHGIYLLIDASTLAQSVNTDGLIRMLMAKP